MLKRLHLYFSITTILVILFCPPMRAAWQEVGPMTPGPAENNQIIFHSSGATAIVTVLAPDLVRIRLGQGTTLGPDYSWAVVKTDWPQAHPQIGGDKAMYKIRTSEIEVRIQMNPFRAAFYDLAGRLISKDADTLGAAWNGSKVRSWKWMPPDEHYFGLGEKAGSLDKRGHSYVMWNTDPAGYDSLTDPMYQTVPFFVGIRQGKAYGIFFDNTYRSFFDMGAESSDTYSFGAEGGEMNYYFFYGPDPKTVVTRFTELVGRTALPPRWSLGYLQSSDRYYPDSAYYSVAYNFRQRHIPCDGIFFDTAYMDANRDFTWDKAGFPDPSKLLSDLRQKGIHSFAIIDPGVKVQPGYSVYDQGVAGGHFLKRKNGEVYTGEMWPGTTAFPDFTSEKTRAWWATVSGNFAKAGLSGYLTDMNEPTVDAVPVSQEWIPKPLDPDVVHYDHGLHSPDAKNHNIYGMLMSEATRDGLLQSQPHERPFVITRATYAGGQRFAAQWTGDNLATWEDLHASVRMIQSMGMSGFVFVGSDSGGFIQVPSSELYTRWLEAGVFHPFFWTHSGARVHPVDPWSFGPQMEDVNRRTIELRYRLLPYLYTAFYQSTQTGLPIIRPLVLEYPDDPRVFDETPANELDEFLFGEDLLVAPVVRSEETNRKVYLPRGTWFDFERDHAYTGPLTLTVDTPLEAIPIFVRGGAILPMQQVVEFSNQAPINSLTFEVYPEGSSSREYYEDDGISLDYQRGGYLHERMTSMDDGNSIKIRATDLSGKYIPPPRSVLLKVHAQPVPAKAVRLNGQALESMASAAELEKANSGAAYDSESRVLYIKFPDANSPFEVQVDK
ncbi:MAG: TIM-barrel domain-containing protein [Terriglobia bacterium]|jgi:alpha-glucosidase